MFVVASHIFPYVRSIVPIYIHCATSLKDVLNERSEGI